ncbi:phosphonate C-P lyase system protein PhnH [Salinicoccus albus]|uniref:phosphonate C-P lyase system protein PhnH n=1 Tax=Salinicoccus albus TaxID=418756 RepID=UPI00037D6012|nr:phosphonate C-P lyase system protein PhnH [Salinicoccus albus]
MQTMVHMTQQHYRELVDLYSRPGEIRISGFDTSNYSTFSDSTLATVLTLFDNEVSFSTSLKQDAEEFSTLTGAHCTENLDAEFVVVKAGELTEKIFHEAAVGTLGSPEQSTTLIIEVPSIGEGQKYALRGPGIKDINTLEMTIDAGWMALRSEKCLEFPLGIDLIIADQDNQLCVIPRTTKVEVK